MALLYQSLLIAFVDETDIAQGLIRLTEELAQYPYQRPAISFDGLEFEKACGVVDVSDNSIALLGNAQQEVIHRKRVRQADR